MKTVIAFLLLAVSCQAQFFGSVNAKKILGVPVVCATPQNGDVITYDLATTSYVCAAAGVGGDFSGPASSVSGNLVKFSSTSGKSGSDSGIAADSVVLGATSLTAGKIPYVVSPGNLGQDSAFGWTVAQTAYPTGILTLGTGTQAFQLSGRGTDSGASQGVPYFRSATANTPTAFDISPNGYVTGTAAWIDFCGNDLQPLNTVHFNCGTMSFRGRVWAFTGGTLVSIVVSGGVATVTTATAHSLSSGAVNFQVIGSSFDPGTAVSTITVTSTTSFTFTSGKPNGTYTTGMVIMEQGVINIGAHYSTGSLGSILNFGGTTTTLSDRVENGTPVAYAAFTDAVAAFKSAGVDKVRWSGSKFKVASDQYLGFTSGTDAASGSMDSAFYRKRAGLVEINSGTLIGTTVGNARDLIHRFGFLAESSSDPSASDLTVAGSNVQDVAAVYTKSDKLVIAYNRSGTVNYLTIPLDGSTTTFTQSTTAP